MRLVLFAGVVLLALAPSGVRAGADSGIRLPVRLTAGGTNQYMGWPASDGRTLYYVTDRNATTEVMRLDLEAGRGTLAIDLAADAVWPRPSPDGKSLLFVSYRDDATGDACVQDIATRTLRCLTGSATADAQPFWFPDGRSIGVLQRTGIADDVVLRRVPLSGGAGSDLGLRNCATPAVSPDARWIAAVEVERRSKDLGTAFAARASRSILLAEGGSRVQWRPALPGASASPAFSTDGRWLYFVQYLNDTNLDGVVDGDDNGVVFRVPFDTDATPPIRDATVPEQLTSAAWNCRYPAPARDRLIVTCSVNGALDVFWLPLEGAVPAAWGLARIGEEVEASRDHFERLLLLGRSLSVDPDPRRRVVTLRRMLRLHLESREFESAAFYADAVSRAPEAPPATREWAEVMKLLAGHRSAEVKLVRGQLSDTFVQGAVETLARLARYSGSSSPDVAALAAIVRSEVVDVLGREGDALTAFEQAVAAGASDPEVLLAVAARAEALLPAHGRRGDLLALYAGICRRPEVPVADRARLADLYVRELTRGMPRAEAIARVEEALGRAEKGGVLAFRLTVERYLLDVGARDDDEVRRDLFEAYKNTKEPWSRKVLVAATVTRAAPAGREPLAYEFANSYVSWVRREDAERKHAERLYRGVVAERAYADLAAGNAANARGWFYGIGLQVDDLESHMGFIEAWIAEGKGDVRPVYSKRDPSDPVRAFAEAYLAARDMPRAAEAGTLESLSRTARERLAIAASAFPNAWEVHHLAGFVAHQRFLRTGDPEDATQAQSRYQVALDLSAGNPRGLAAVHQDLGLLLSDLGAHAAAVRHLKRRATWPFRDGATELSVRLALARSLFHAGRETESADEAARALALADAEGPLRRYLPLVLDRAALFSLVAGNASEAVRLYDRLEALGSGRSETVDRAADLVATLKLRIGRGSAALAAGDPGRAIADLDEARRILLSMRELPPEPPHFPFQPLRERVFGRDATLALVAGLRARAFRDAGRLAEAAGALRERRDILLRRLGRDDLDEDVLDLAAVHRDLAECAYRQGDVEGALAEVEAGLRRAREFAERTGTETTAEAVALARSYAELHLFGHVPVERLTLLPDVRRTYDRLCATGDPAFATDRAVLGTWLAWIDAGRNQ